MTYTRTVAPTLDPIGLEEAKQQLQQDFDHEDTFIESLIKVATAYTEQVTDRSLLTQTWTKTLDYFPGCIELLKGPITAISSIQYQDVGNVQQTLSTSIYQTDLISPIGRIMPAYGQSWPTTYQETNAVTITFTAGYGSSGASIPTPLKQAILLMIRHLYDNRSVMGVSNTEKLNAVGFDTLIANYRLNWA